MGHVAVRVLGRPMVEVEDTTVALGGRALVLVLRLAMAEGQPVSQSRLLADVWPEGATEGAVRVALTRARKDLGPDAIVRTGGGYLLEDASLDAARFERLVAAGRDRSSTMPHRLGNLDEALRLWTGSAFDGLGGVTWIDNVARRYDELREQAIDERFELLLFMGEHERAIPDLRAEVSRLPTREHRAELLALALYRSGRQADALALLDDTRVELRERLGLDPGPSLRELEQRVLRHDPALAGRTHTDRVRDAANIEADLRAAITLVKSGAFAEAGGIIDETEQAARAVGDRRGVGLALLAKAQMIMMSGQGDPHPVIDAARQIGRELRDGKLLTRAAMVRFGSGVQSDRRAVIVELTEPIELLPSNSPEQVDLLCIAAVIVTFIDASDVAARLVEQAERVYAETGTDRARCVLLVARGLLGSVHGDPLDVVEARAVEAYQLARSLEDPHLVVAAIQALLRVRYGRGDLAGVDELLEPLDRAARAALLPFGIVRVMLCRSTNATARGELDRVPEMIERAAAEGARLRTFATESATATQRAVINIEFERFDQIIPHALAAEARVAQPAGWRAVRALCGDVEAAESLLEIGHEMPRNDGYPSFCALSANVAALRCDARLGAWCAPRLDALGDRAIVVGLGTAVLGFAPHVAALARVATGETVAAVERFERAIDLAHEAGAWLWRAHSLAELAVVLSRQPDEASQARAASILEQLEASGVAQRSPRVMRRVRAARDMLTV